MANDNETVKQLCEEMVQETLHFRTVHVDYYGDRILSAHKREMAAKDAEIEKLKFNNMRLKSEQRTAAECIISQTNKVVAKNAEIEELKKENARLRVIVSGATVSDGNLREEIERLREIVKELADELETMICNEIVKSSKRRVKRSG